MIQRCLRVSGWTSAGACFGGMCHLARTLPSPGMVELHSQQHRVVTSTGIFAGICNGSAAGLVYALNTSDAEPRGWHDLSEHSTGLGAHPLKWKTNVPVCMHSLAFLTPSVSCVRLYRSCGGRGEPW
jgi:hypothetical protein